MANKKYPSGPFWLLGIYLTIFTLSITLYQNRLNTFDNRYSNLINFSDSKNLRIFFREYKRIKSFELLVEPKIHNPIKTFSVIFGVMVINNKDLNALADLLEGVKLYCNDRELSNINFSGMQLSYANFEGSRLIKVNFQHSNLTGANLIYANLKDSRCTGAILSMAKLANTCLDNTKLDSCYMDSTSFPSEMTNASFTNSYCRNTIFRGNNLDTVNFKNTDLSNADFQFVRSINFNIFKDAKSLAGAKFNPGHLKKIKQNYTWLFEMIKKKPTLEISSEDFFNSLSIPTPPVNTSTPLNSVDYRV